MCCFSIFTNGLIHAGKIHQPLDSLASPEHVPLLTSFENGSNAFGICCFPCGLSAASVRDSYSAVIIELRPNTADQIKRPASHEVYSVAGIDTFQVPGSKRQIGLAPVLICLATCKDSVTVALPGEWPTPLMMTLPPISRVCRNYGGQAGGFYKSRQSKVKVTCHNWYEAVM